MDKQTFEEEPVGRWTVILYAGAAFLVGALCVIGFTAVIVFVLWVSGAA